MKPLLSVRNLRKIYPGSPPHTAVDGISFDLHPGEILGFLGPNGAGKTTTIQILIGALTYTSGTIEYFGLNFAKERSRILQKVSFASTYIGLPPRLTIEQNLHVAGALYGLSSAETRRRAEPLLKRFGLFDRRHRRTAALSSGQITRLMVVKAFLTRPSIVLLDEPTASLDPDVAQDVCAFLREERADRGLSILFTSHKMDEVAALCDRVLFLQKGKVVADDRPAQLARSVSSCKLHLIISDGLKRTISLAEKSSLSYTVDYRAIAIAMDATHIPTFLTALARAEVSYSGIRIEEPSLEDYFLTMAKQ
jgi:ABC-2 type transport system ATP-binding protein